MQYKRKEWMMHILKRIIPTNGNDKRNDYTIKYNVKMTNNIEMKSNKC